MKVFFSPEFVAAHEEFDTTRKAGWVADSLRTSPIDGVEVATPQPLTARQIARVHSRKYIRALKTGKPARLAESQGFAWDEQLFPMVAASNGGVVAAAYAALTNGVSGSLSSGLHHAYRNEGAGFCSINGLAIAARDVVETKKASSVLILDLDAHCGGGTESLIADDPRIRQLDVSTDAFDGYRSTPHAQLHLVRSAEQYLRTIVRGLDRLILDGPQPGLVLYNAGVDPFEGCAIGGLEGVTAEILAQREQLVFDWCSFWGIPVAFVLAGGYIGQQTKRVGKTWVPSQPELTQAVLVDLHRSTLFAAASTCPGRRGNAKSDAQELPWRRITGRSS